MKPLVVDGSLKSHALFLAYDHISLSELEAPMVLQEFINHGMEFLLVNICRSAILRVQIELIMCEHPLVGGVLFKVFIIGDSIKVVRRFSLPDVTESDLSKLSGVFGFPRVSCADSSADDAVLDPAVAGKFSKNQQKD